MEKIFKTTEGGPNGDINFMEGRNESDIRYVITMDTIDDVDVTIIAGMTNPGEYGDPEEPWTVDYYLTSNGQKLIDEDIEALQQWLQDDLG